MGVADFDGNGTLDMVLANNNAAPTVYLNRLESVGNWVNLHLEGEKSNRNAVGARVILEAGGKKMHRVVKAGSGFASQAPLALHFGLAAATRIDSLEVTWPGGRVERFEGEQLKTPINCKLSLREGSGNLVLCGHDEVGQATQLEGKTGDGGGGQR